MSGIPEILAARERRALQIAAVGALLLGVGAAFGLRNVFEAYLFAFLYWGGLSLGCFSVFLLHNLTGGGWGLPIRRFIEAGTRTLPLVALLFIPVAAGMHWLYEWTHADVVAADAVLRHKEPWLNTPFFLGRTAFYFAVWILLGRRLLRLTKEFEATADPAVRHRRASWSAGGILLYVLTMSFAAFDWAMSLEPHWFSTIYGLHFVVSQALAAYALGIAGAAWLARREPFAKAFDADRFNDLGNFLIAFVLLWAYVSFSQYLIIWSGNLPEETPWYLARSTGGWQAVAVALALAHFAVPFVLLLSRRRKRDPRRLAKVAVWVLAARVLDEMWLVTPAFHPGKFPLSILTELFALAAVGGVWFAVFSRHLRRHPLEPAPAPAGGELKESPA